MEKVGMIDEKKVALIGLFQILIAQSSTRAKLVIKKIEFVVMNRIYINDLRRYTPNEILFCLPLFPHSAF